MTAQKKTALLSASDKTGLEIFAGKLVELGWDILASAGTAKYLNEKGIKARDVAEIVGPPILGHRVVTLSREVHAGLLALNNDVDIAELEQNGAPRIDLAYVNFYALLEEIARPGSTLESVVDKTDIGGPTMLHSAGKGRRIVVCSPVQFKIALKCAAGAYDSDPAFKEKIISGLVGKAEGLCADYCRASSAYHFRSAGPEFSREMDALAHTSSVPLLVGLFYFHKKRGA